MANYSAISSVITAAQRDLRGAYACAVVSGRQLWSGADLQGKAKSYGGGYARQRNKAYTALRRAGGEVLAVDHGKRVTAVRICTDDFGNAVYATTDGLAWPHTRSQYKIGRTP